MYWRVPAVAPAQQANAALSSIGPSISACAELVHYYRRPFCALPCPSACQKPWQQSLRHADQCYPTLCSVRSSDRLR